MKLLFFILLSNTVELPEWLDKTIAILLPFKHYLIAVMIAIITFIAAQITRKAIKRQFEKSNHLGTKDPTNYIFLRNGISFVFSLIGIILIFYSIPALRSLGTTLFAGAGILAAIIGFASQAAFSNIIGGLFIVIFKPFRVGDILQVGTWEQGFVENITLRHTVIRSYKNERYIIPNSTINSEVLLNSSIEDEKTCVYLEMGISYDSDVDLAMKIMSEEAEKHPSILDNRTIEEKKNGDPIVRVRLINFGDSSVNLRAYLWAKDFVIGFVMRTDLYKSIKKRFDAEGIEIPFPYRTIVFKDEEKAKRIRTNDSKT